jgi:hypothetical protein
MKKMKSPVKAIDEEIEIMDNYEEKFVTFQNRTIIKKQLEEMYKGRIIKYLEDEKKEEKWKNFSSMIINLLFPRKCGPI